MNHLSIIKYKITSIEKSTDSVNIYRMEPIEKKLEFKPGQFVYIHIFDEQGNTIIKKPYSIASSPSADYLEFCIKMVNGAMTSKLEKLMIGTDIGIEGPLGHFQYNEQKNVGLIASGTGVAPMLSILRDIAGKKLDGNFVLLYSTRTKETIIYQEEFERIQKLNPKIKIIITLTREESEWNGEKGRINKELITKYIQDPKNTDWWMCGSMGMIKSMKEFLIELKVDTKRIKMEGWG
ncbi:MAG: FAD-dependent oxidoreductase [Candidatus Micrarchaeota archaeon]